jgi:hypothetical protein
MSVPTNINPPQSQLNQAVVQLTQLVAGVLLAVRIPLLMPERLVMFASRPSTFPSPTTAWSIPLDVQLRLAGKTVLSLPADTTGGAAAAGRGVRGYGQGLNCFATAFPFPSSDLNTVIFIAGNAGIGRCRGQSVACVADEAVVFAPEPGWWDVPGSFDLTLAVASMNEGQFLRDREDINTTPL